MGPAVKARCIALAIGVMLAVFAASRPVAADGELRDGPLGQGELTPSHSMRALDELMAGAAPAGRPTWEVLTTPNFRVLHLDAGLARRVAHTAERLRRAQLRAWTGGDEAYAPAWKERCDLYLFTSFREMIVMTGGQPKAGSALVRPSRLYHGRILSRRVNLAANDPGLFRSTLPHEVTHVVLGDLLGGKLPLWANEGAASVAEGPAKQRYYRAIVRHYQARERIYALDVLMNMSGYPDGAYKMLFYAQSASLVGYLLDLGGKPNFLAFLQYASDKGYDWALRYVYEIAGFEDLQGRWRVYLGRD